MNGRPPGRRYGPVARAWNVFMVILIFLLVAPPVAAVSFVALTVLWIARFAPETPEAYVGFASMIGLMVAYALALAPAAFTGALFALWQSFIGRIGWVAASAVGLCAGAFMSLATADETALALPPAFALWLLTSLVSTLAAWAVARSFVTAGPDA